MARINRKGVSKAARELINEVSKPRGRQLNSYARTVRWQALESVTTGDHSQQIGTHGRTFLDQLRYQLVENPSVELRHIELSTPCDEGGKNGAPGGVNAFASIQSLYLMALQNVNTPAEPKEEPKLIEHAASWDWD